MTTIAVNRVMMAGDKQFTHGSGMKLIGKTKIYEAPPETCKHFHCKRAFFGFAGGSDSIGRAVEWLYDPSEEMPRLKGIEILLLTNDKKIYYATNLKNWMLVDQPFFAIGSGMPYAMGAMSSGKTPYEAVKIAATLDSSTGKGYNKLEM